MRMTPPKKTMTSVLRMIVIMTAFFCGANAAYASDQIDQNCINEECEIVLHGVSGRIQKLYDYSKKTSLRLKQDVSVEVILPENKSAECIFIQFAKAPDSFSVCYYDNQGSILSTTVHGTEEDSVFSSGLPLPEYAEIVPDGSRSFVFSAGSEGYLSELRVYLSSADLPKTVQEWKPPYEKADILFVSAHPDDEHVLMGGIIPLYGAERQKKVQIIYLTADPASRKKEALDGLWSNGLKNMPVFLDFEDIYSKSMEYVISGWEKKTDPLGTLVEQIRKFQPDVAVTHDPNGEYGHGAHQAAAYYMQKAVLLAADAGMYQESAERFGTWQVKKLYLHLYGDADTVLPMYDALEAFDGKSAFDMAQTGYSYHKSQGDDWMKLLRSKKYDCSRYGLAFTTVGEDDKKDDFFEHIE